MVQMTGKVRIGSVESANGIGSGHSVGLNMAISQVAISIAGIGKCLS
jgi:hypothetical protein